ncbi:MAG: hypothetical protein OEL80_06250, partial [Desulfuromonadales bacterium]|nr:hypothetical protein [Desulfuromonadales bacterium]
MLRRLSTTRSALCLLLSCCAMLQGCASTGKPAAEVKTGMYIDAGLEFVVEYPLAWNKDRRLVFGRREGEVRWTHPEHPHTLLRIKSYLPQQQTLR